MLIKVGDKCVKFNGSVISFPKTEDTYPEDAVFTPVDLSVFTTIEHKTRDKFKGFNSDDINGNDSSGNYDQLIYIIRHSEREKTDEDTSGKDGSPDGVFGGLTKKGYEYAENAGAWLRSQNNAKFALEDCGFFCTDTKRTWQTVQAFAKGLLNLDHLPTSSEIGAKNGAAAYKLDFDPEGKCFNYSWPACSTYADSGAMTADGQTGDATQFDLKVRELLSNVIGLAGDKKFTLCISHDFNTLPLVSWACSQSLQWNFTGGSTDKWLCYLAGVVIAINRTDNILYLKPIYGIDDSHQGIMAQGYDNILK